MKFNAEIIRLPSRFFFEHYSKHLGIYSTNLASALGEIRIQPNESWELFKPRLKEALFSYWTTLLSSDIDDPVIDENSIRAQSWDNTDAETRAQGNIVYIPEITRISYLRGSLDSRFERPVSQFFSDIKSNQHIKQYDNILENFESLVLSQLINKSRSPAINPLQIAHQAIGSNIEARSKSDSATKYCKHHSPLAARTGKIVTHNTEDCFFLFPHLQPAKRQKPNTSNGCSICRSLGLPISVSNTHIDSTCRNVKPTNLPLSAPYNQSEQQRLRSAEQTILKQSQENLRLQAQIDDFNRNATQRASTAQSASDLQRSIRNLDITRERQASSASQRNYDDSSPSHDDDIDN